MSNIVAGIKNCEMITDLLNDIIRDSGKIDINNSTIWQGFLHQPEVDNTFWEDTLTALETLMEHAPDAFSATNKTQIWDARSVFNQYKDRHLRVLDTKQDGMSLKTYAWKTIMTTREVINAINGVDLPNSDASRTKQPA